MTTFRASSKENLLTALGLALLAFSATPATALLAQEDDASKRAALVLKHVQVNEGEVVRLLVPDYDEKLATLERQEAAWLAKGGRDDDRDFLYSARVIEAIETDLGIKNRRFLLVAVDGVDGVCAQCAFTRVGVVDLVSRQVLFKREHTGLRPEPSLSTFRLRASDPSLCFRFRTGDGTLNMGGYSEETEEWYRPSESEGGALQFDKIWSQQVGLHYLDDRTQMSEETCASMTPVLKAGNYEYRRRACFYKWNDPDDEDQEGPSRARSGESNPESWEDGPTCGLESCGVEIRAWWSWRWDEGAGRLVRLAGGGKRINHDRVSTFPFNLPVRNPQRELLFAPAGVSHGSCPGPVRVDAPRGKLWAELNPGAGARPGLPERIRISSNDGTKRTITLPEFSWGTFSVSSIGWSSDATRVFVVVRLGPDLAALVSFAVAGSNDFWEKLLVGPGDSWNFGFVAVPKKRRKES